MILRYTKFENIQNKIPEDLYNRPINRKKRVLEEDLNLRITMINKPCQVDSKEDSDIILKGIEPLMRNKRREIILMGGNQEDVR